MSNTKRVWQKQLEHWKHKANHLISGAGDYEETIELEPLLLLKCKELAEANQTTVNDVIHQIIEQYWVQRKNELSAPITREHIDRNPLFLLDALANRNFNPFGVVEESSYEPS